MIAGKCDIYEGRLARAVVFTSAKHAATNFCMVAADDEIAKRRAALVAAARAIQIETAAMILFVSSAIGLAAGNGETV